MSATPADMQASGAMRRICYAREATGYHAASCAAGGFPASVDRSHATLGSLRSSIHYCGLECDARGAAPRVNGF